MFPSGPPGLSGTPGVSRAYGSRLYCASTIDHDDITASFTHNPFIKTVEWEMLDKRLTPFVFFYNHSKKIQFI